ncbi:MAG: hypothetical protein HKM00_09140 [Gallionella sp.]|nr:hypothetical protein [Gallionella sp.]
MSVPKIKTKPPGVARQLVTFSCFAKEKVTKKKATPVCRRCAVPSISRKQAGLRNSHDPLRGQVLKQCSPNLTARLRLVEAAHRGIKAKSENENHGGQQVARHIEADRQGNSTPVHCGLLSLIGISTHG